MGKGEKIIILEEYFRIGKKNIGKNWEGWEEVGKRGRKWSLLGKHRKKGEEN
jgi:hypothetical protein